MRVIYVYNPHSAFETALKTRAVNELQTYVEEVESIDFQAIKDIYRIRATPALIIIRDDLQGEHLLEEDIERGQLRLALECYKALQEQESNIYQKDTKRIDSVVLKEVAIQMGENYQVMQDMASLLDESGVL